jgi:predicted neuraminidase
MLPAEHVKTSVVFSYPNSDPYDRANLYGFNHAPNVAEMPDGSLMAAWFSGAHEGDVHQVILGARSRDGGLSWSEAKVLADVPRVSDFDPAFIVKNNTASLIFSSGRWNRYPFVGMREAEKKEIGLDSFRLHLIRSADSGATWSPPVDVLSRRGFCCRNGITLRSGQMLVPIYDDAGKGRWVTSLLSSTDDGASWSWVGQIGAADGKAGGEPAIVELDNGDVLLAMRSTDGRIWFARSADAGKTWSAPFASDFDAAASACALYRDKRGRVFLAYDACKPPLRSPLVVRSLDQKNMTWGEPVQIASVSPPAGDVWSHQVSYPSISEANDGALVVVWTEISMSPASQGGRIMCARIMF